MHRCAKTGFWEHDWPYVYVGEGSESQAGNVGLFITTDKDTFSIAHAFVEFPVDPLATLSPQLVRVFQQAVALYAHQLPRDKQCRTHLDCFDAVFARLERWYPELRDWVREDWINKENWVAR